VQGAVAIFDRRQIVEFVMHAGNKFCFSEVPSLATSRGSMWSKCASGPVVKHTFT